MKKLIESFEKVSSNGIVENVYSDINDNIETLHDGFVTLARIAAYPKRPISYPRREAFSALTLEMAKGFDHGFTVLSNAGIVKAKAKIGKWRGDIRGADQEEWLRDLWSLMMGTGGFVDRLSIMTKMMAKESKLLGVSGTQSMADVLSSMVGIMSRIIKAWGDIDR